jgi:hypothetical protein
MVESRTPYIDGLSQILGDSRKLANLLRFLARAGILACLLLIGTLWAITEVFARRGVATFGVSLAGATMSMRDTLERVENFLRSVDPHGWESTGIRLQVGDRVRFFATGRINVDLPGLINAVLLRLSLETRVSELKRIDRRSTLSNQTPEFYWPDVLTQAEREALVPRHRWCGPDGIPDDGPSARAFAARAEQRLMPSERLGSLIGAVVPDNASPSKNQAFYIGRDMRGTELTVESAGILHVGVNDVIDVHDQRHGDIFLHDNLGSYSLSISVNRAR